MKKTLTVIGLMTALVVLTSGFYADSGKVKYCGSPGEGTCHSCHNTNPMNQMQATIAFGGQQSASFTYTPGDVYNLCVMIDNPYYNDIGGFAVEFLDSAGNDAGRILLTDTNTKLMIANVGTNKRTTIVHKDGHAMYVPVLGRIMYEFKWSVPDHDIGTITIHTIYVGGDGDGTPANDYCTYWSLNFTYNPPIINSISEVQSVTTAPTYKFYDLQGKQVANSYYELSLLPKAIYIADSSGVRKKIIN